MQIQLLLVGDDNATTNLKHEITKKYRNKEKVSYKHYIADER